MDLSPFSSPVAKADADGAITAPVELTGEVRAIVLPTREFQKYFQVDDDTYIYDVTAKGVTAYTGSKGRWVALPPAIFTKGERTEK